MEFRLLGPVEAVRDGRSLPLGGAKPRALLAILVMHANEVVARERLIEALWPSRAPAGADHSLDVQVSRLRKALEPDEPLATRGGGYVLEADPEQIDVHSFEQLLDEGRRENADGKPIEALAALERALALWRGDALGELRYEEFAQTEVDRLEELAARRDRGTSRRGACAGSPRARSWRSSSRLIAKHPLRERLRGQLMLALYRSGRQAEALRVYADTRRRLVEELGIEPSQQLRELEQGILRQDPALDLPRRRLVTQKRRALAGAGALAAAGAVVAVVVGLTQGSTENAQALADPDSNVFLSASSGELVRAASVRDTVRVAYGEGALWSISSTGELTRLDPATGKELARVGLGIKPSGLAVGEGSVWVTGRTSPILLRIDPTVDAVDGRFQLPMKGVETDLTGEVAVGAGSVWVGHGGFQPRSRGWSASTRRQDAFRGAYRSSRATSTTSRSPRAPSGSRARHRASFGRSTRERSEVVFRRILQPQLCCIAAGGGYVWAASNPDGVVWKVSTGGDVLPTITLGSAIESLIYADGAVWAALGEEGTVVRIDPTTDEIREYDLGHFVTSVDVRKGLIAAGVRQSIEDVAGDLSGDVVRVGRKGPELFDSGAPVEPAFTFPTWDAPQEMFHYMTCARLLNYADAEGEAGRKLVPEVAEDLPEVSDGGRTFTFKIRKGFRLLTPVERGGDGRVVPRVRSNAGSSSRSLTASHSRPP